MMTFRSRLKFKWWGRCMEKALLPLAEWFRTSRKRLSCCLKSYSTLEGQTCNTKWLNPPPKLKCKIAQNVSNTALAKNANECLNVLDLHIQLIFLKKKKCLFKPQIATNCVAAVYFALCGTPCVGSSVLVRLQSGWLVWAGRYFRRCTRLVWISLSSTWPFRTRCQHTPAGESSYVTSFCQTEAVLKISGSRGMFWIFQDKDSFRFCFVEHKAFFFLSLSPENDEKAFRFLSLT